VKKDNAPEVMRELLAKWPVYHGWLSLHSPEGFPDLILYSVAAYRCSLPGAPD
jgi:hypothetical protein